MTDTSLRTGIELNQILIAKLYDEQRIYAGEQHYFTSNADSTEQLMSRIRQLYKEAMSNLGGETFEEDSWSLSPKALKAIVELLENYALSSVTPSILGQLFWQSFFGASKKYDILYTPKQLAEFLVQLADPRPDQFVIDPACGTGLLLIEIIEYMASKSDKDYQKQEHFSEKRYSPTRKIAGIEVNTELAKLAATNLALNGISPAQVINANALDKEKLDQAGNL